MQPREFYINIGMSASVTGRYSLPGRQALAGVQAWVEDTNRLGGIQLKESGSRTPVRLVHYDDGSKAGRCAEATEQLLAGDRVDILLGPYSSGLTLKAVPVAQKYHRVLWDHGGASEVIYDLESEWVVSVLSPASLYFRGVVDMVRQTKPLASGVAIVHSTAGAFPRDVAGGAKRYCVEAGLGPVQVYPYEAGTTDFGPVLRTLRSVQPHVILSVGRIEDDLEFVRQLNRSGLKVGTVGVIAAPLTMFGESLGDVAEGIVGPSQWEPCSAVEPDYGPSTQEVLRSFESRRGFGIDYPMAQAYAGCLVAQRCIEDAGSLDNTALREVAAGLDFTTFYGRFLIEPATGRQLGHPMPVVQWKMGEKVVVWPPGAKSV